MPGVAGRKNSKGIIGLVLGVTLLAVGIGGAFLAADAAGAGLGAGFGAYAVGSAGFGITWAGIALMGASMLPQRDQLADDQRAESS